MNAIKVAIPSCFLRKNSKDCVSRLGAICDKCEWLQKMTKYYRCTDCQKIFLFKEDLNDHQIAVNKFGPESKK
jgi:hypothetical protein